MGREEFRHVIVKKGEPRSPQSLSIRRKVKLSAHDARLELGGAVAPIPPPTKNPIQIRQQEDIHAGIGGNLLTQAEVPGIAAEVPLFQKLQRHAVAAKHVGAGRQALDGVDDQVEVIERWPPGWEKVGGNSSRHPIEHGGELFQRNRVAGELAGR